MSTPSRIGYLNLRDFFPGLCFFYFESNFTGFFRKQWIELGGEFEYARIMGVESKGNYLMPFDIQFAGGSLSFVFTIDSVWVCFPPFSRCQVIQMREPLTKYICGGWFRLNQVNGQDEIEQTKKLLFHRGF